MAFPSLWFLTGIGYSSVKYGNTFFSLLGTKLLHSTAYHPQSDGQTERVNQCLEMYLRCAVHNTPTLWKQWLPLAELWYNSSFHTSLGCSPFKALYGHEPNLLLLHQLHLLKLVKVFRRYCKTEMLISLYSRSIWQLLRTE